MCIVEVLSMHAFLVTTIVSVLLTTALPVEPWHDASSIRLGTVYSCSHVYIRTSPNKNASLVVLPDGTYATVSHGDVVLYTDHSPYWVHLSSGIGFIPAQSLNDTECFVDAIPAWIACLQQFATSVPSPNEHAATIVAAYAYYSAHYNVDPFFVLAQAFHESNVLRSSWATVHFNYAGLWVSGAYRTTPPQSGYWVQSGSRWIAGRSFPSLVDGVREHVRIVASYPSLQSVLSRWAADPHYADKVWTWYRHLTSRCGSSYD